MRSLVYEPLRRTSGWYLPPSRCLSRYLSLSHSQCRSNTTTLQPPLRIHAHMYACTTVFRLKLAKEYVKNTPTDVCTLVQVDQIPLRIMALRTALGEMPDPQVRAQFYDVLMCTAEDVQVCVCVCGGGGCSCVCVFV